MTKCFSLAASVSNLLRRHSCVFTPATLIGLEKEAFGGDGRLKSPLRAEAHARLLTRRSRRRWRCKYSGGAEAS